MIKFPFTSLQQFNLDWIMQQLHKILQFMPLNGVAGDVLQRNADGAVWQPISALSFDIHSLNPITPPVASNDEIPIYDSDMQGIYKATVQDILDGAAVQSVNGQTGTVVLDATDVGALPDTTVIPTDTSDLTNTAGYVDAAGAAAAAPVQSVNGQTGNVIVSGGGAVDSVNGQTGTVVLGKSDVGLGNVDNVQQYSASNPPPYPVTSVNGQTGAVTIPASSSSPVLLWTNSTPLASFTGPQSVAIDLTDYSFVIVEFLAGQYMSPALSALFPVPTLTPPVGYSTYNELQGVAQNGAARFIVHRYFQITASGFNFGTASIVDVYNSSGTNNDQYCRPYRIWGIV